TPRLGPAETDQPRRLQGSLPDLAGRRPHRRDNAVRQCDSDRGSAVLMIPDDYEDRVYAGVLGKVIAVYLGRPFEGWRYQRIVDELGDITYYVNDRTDLPLKNHLLVVTDDDISGTLVFPRALRDHGVEPTSEQVGQTWLDQIVEEQTVLWWGGLGNSTEH